MLERRQKEYEEREAERKRDTSWVYFLIKLFIEITHNPLLYGQLKTMQALPTRYCVQKR